MTDINKVLSEKRAWNKPDQRKSERRVKDGSEEDRRSTADAIRAGRAQERHIMYCSCSICEMRKAEKRHFRNACIVVTSIMMAMAMMLFFSKQAHAEDVDLRAIAEIESSNNPDAVNPRTDAIGLYQITPVCVRDYNQFHTFQYTIEKMFEPHMAWNVANWYLNQRIPSMLRHYKIPDTLDNRLWAYNAGIGKVVRGVMPKESRAYIAKYKLIENTNGK